MTPALPSRVPLWLLVLVTLGGTLAMHMFVPALPSAMQALHSTPAQMQLTVTLYVLGLGLGQLIYGPLSDSLGRRPMLMTGLAIYIAASLLAMLAPNAETLIGARLVQALGGCAGLALGRAIARDTGGAESTVKTLALLNLMVLMGPGFSPFIGTVADTLWGWRGVFGVLMALGLITLLGVWRLLPETHPPSGHFDARKLAQDYARLLRNPRFVAIIVGGGCATMCIYAFIASAPFIFMHGFHTTQYQMSIYVGGILCGMGLGNILASRLSSRLSLRRTMMSGNVLAICSSGALVALELSQHLSVGWFLGLMVMFNFALGLISPTALTMAVSAEPELVGSAAGVYGASQMGIGAIATVLTTLGSNPLLSSSSVLLGANLIGFACFQLHRRLTRQG